MRGFPGGPQAAPQVIHFRVGRSEAVRGVETLLRGVEIVGVQRFDSSAELLLQFRREHRRTGGRRRHQGIVIPLQRDDDLLLLIG